jgi:eukaryotic-like serine/threonine-protein kinase
MFNGNARFKLLRQLGAGGMGVVYEALDRHRNARVALKTLSDADADLLYRLKREFRSLRDLVHPNLVGLGELFEEAGYWFFTMELLEGEDLSTYFQRITRSSPPTASELTLTLPAGANHDGLGQAVTSHEPPSLGILPPPRARAPLDYAVVHTVFGQLAEGLLAIHDAGKIHRDIKPSNIIVTHQGRVVILDFGLATEQWDADRSGHDKIIGTVIYMAPEQAAGAVTGPPADWYSLGVVLYEVIVGRRPFDGSPGLVLAAKQSAIPSHPQSINPDCPNDLAELCMQLLQIDPSQRPEGSEVLRRFGVNHHRASSHALSSSASSSQRKIFVGRDPELDELRRAFDDLDGAGSIAAFIQGESGVGKTTLINHFINSIERAHEGTIVLSGQCREHEAIPFKAMDGVIDALSRHVCRLSDVAAAELVPQHASLLPSVFPVLARIGAIARAPAPIRAAGDPFQRRKRVFTALREMLCRLTERYKVICFIDDMQWVDSDSLHLLRELLRPPEQPRMLLIASVRTGDGALAIPHLPGQIRSIALQRLSTEESVTLTEMLLDRMAPEQKSQTSRIVDETGGHPLFIGELARYAASGSQTAPQLRLDEAIWARARHLTDDALGVLKVLSIAVAPLPLELVRVAAGLKVDEFQKSVSLLRANNLVRSAAPAQNQVEVYHDRVRQSIILHLGDDERIALNERIAGALDSSLVHMQPELLIHHLQGAGNFSRAAREALEAAERAQTGLAFEQAAQLYETALRLGSWSEAEQREIYFKLGGALASAGRGPDAAAAYTKAAHGADPTTQLTCRIQVADQLVQSGRLESGATLLFSLFEEHGVRVPEARLGLALRVAWYRLRLTFRGLRFRDRPPHELSLRELAMLSLYDAASRGLILVDPVLAAYFVLRGIGLALDTGARSFLVRFLVLETGFRTSESVHRHRAFLAAADALMQQDPDPSFRPYLRLNQGTRSYFSFERGFVEAFEMLDSSDDELAQSANAAWELSAGRFFIIYSLRRIGDFSKLRPYAERFIREAEQRGNIYTRTTISRLSNILWLVDDDTAGARDSLNIDSWISFERGYHMQHWLEFNARVEISLYEDAPIDAAFLHDHLKRLKKSFLQRVIGYRCDAAWLVGRVALSEMKRDPSRRSVVRKSIANLRSAARFYPRMLAEILAGTLAVHEQDVDRAIKHFGEVAAMGEASQIQFITAVARNRLGALMGGDEGRALTEASERWLADAGIKDAPRMIHLASPCTVDGVRH